MAITVNLNDVENSTNKQNNLTADITDTKYPTVTAVNSGLSGKATGTGSASGTNTGDETASSIGLLITNSLDISTIEDTDKFAISDAGGAGNPLKYGLWSLIKSTLKTYFDGIYKATFSENTAFNKNFGTTAGTVLEGNAARYMTIQFTNQIFSPSDSTTYYTGRIAFAQSPSTTASNHTFQAGVDGTVVGINITSSTNTIQGSSENVTAKIRNETTAASSSSFGNFTTDSTATTSKIFNLTGATSVIAATDNICIQIDTPAWATNPTGVRLTGWILIKLT